MHRIYNVNPVQGHHLPGSKVVSGQILKLLFFIYKLIISNICNHIFGKIIKNDQIFKALVVLLRNIHLTLTLKGLYDKIKGDDEISINNRK